LWSNVRRLDSITDGNNAVNFAYETNGIRSAKISANGESQYIYNNGRLEAEYISDNAEDKALYFNYGINGISGFTLKDDNGETVGEYIYRKNAQGDVTHIFDEDLSLVAKYEYDAWGNHEIVVDEDGIGTLNPIRYRSYYYDQETGLFYLKSRYYDPDTGRFINADDPSVLDLTSGELNGFNLYVYCLNNPIMYTDSSGQFVVTTLIIGLIIGAIIGATIGGIVAYNMASESGAVGWELAGWTALGVLGGGVIGGAIGAGLGYVAGIAFPGINVALASGFSIGGGGLFAFASGGTAGGGLAFSAATVSTIAVTGAVTAGAIGAGYLLMAKPKSGRIRYSDGTGYTDNGKGGQRPMTQDEANTAYKASKDPTYKANLKRWMKGQGFRTSHLKGFLGLALIGEFLRRFFSGDY
jgi:RHS repeat-associated protein